LSQPQAVAGESGMLAEGAEGQGQAAMPFAGQSTPYLLLLLISAMLVGLGAMIRLRRRTGS
jgi:hypothetical protein